jgi:DNA/RNA-binding domain of Phe-tRNA-synthetase-like protein
VSAALTQRLSAAWVEGRVREAHPDYVAVLVAASGLTPGPTTGPSEAMLREAEVRAGQWLEGRTIDDLPEVMAWRQAYRGFGVRPREARSSVEALVRRAAAGLPRIDRLTDVYNAVSVLHLVPVGGEDVAGYEGPARLVVATGGEPFDTVDNGQAAVHTAAPGEIIWRDDAGVTCRRWNWRQCVRTRLTATTTEALFIIDGLGPKARDRAEDAAADLIDRLAADSPSATFATRSFADQPIGPGPS